MRKLVTVFDLERSSEPVWKGYIDNWDDLKLILNMDRLGHVQEWGLIIHEPRIEDGHTS